MDRFGRQFQRQIGSPDRVGLQHHAAAPKQPRGVHGRSFGPNVSAFVKRRFLGTHDFHVKQL